MLRSTSTVSYTHLDVYKRQAPQPVHWLRFLSDLLYPEDIPTVQEFIGYCLIPSNKGQRMICLLYTSHVDGVGRIANIRKDDTAIWYTIHADSAILRYVVEKGSITIDGVSLTVAAGEPTGFAVSTIPHTCLLYTSRCV